MAQVRIATFRVEMTDWNGNKRTQTSTPQNWDTKHFGPLNAHNFQKWMESQWKGNGAVIHSCKEVVATVDEETWNAFFLDDKGVKVYPNRTSPADRPVVQPE